jgi:hypothetical protein
MENSLLLLIAGGRMTTFAWEAFPKVAGQEYYSHRSTHEFLRRAEVYGILADNENRWLAARENYL